MMSDGDRLSDKEVKYLALTSHELNMFLDKEQYQKYVDLLSPEFIHMLEVNIGEQILEIYQNARNTISNKREEYLKKKNYRMRALINKKDDSSPKKKNETQLDLNRKHQKLTRKAFIQKYFTDKDGNISKYPLFLNEKKKPLKTLLKKAGSFVYNLLNASSSEIEQKPKEKPRQAYSIDLTKTKLKKSLYGDISQKEYYKLKHPESKIIPLSLSNENGFIAQGLLNDQEKNRTKAFDKKPPGNLKRFFKAYSSGPFKGKKADTKISAENRDRAALIIQRIYRGYKARKAIKYMKMMNFDNLSGKIRASGQDKITNSKTDSSVIRPKSQILLRSPTLARAPTLVFKTDSNQKKVGFKLGDMSVNNLNTTNPNLDATFLQPSMSFYKQKTFQFEQEPSANRLAKQKTTQIGFEKDQRNAKKLGKIVGSGRRQQEEPVLDEFLIDGFHQAVQDNDLDAMMRHKPTFLRKLVNMADKSGKFPIDWALEYYNLDSVIFLLENGLSLKKCGLTEADVLEKVKDRKSKRIREYLEIVFRQKPKKTRSASWSNFFQAF